MVEVESHADEAKVLIWEVNHFGEELLHHRLFENEQSTKHTQLNITISYDCFIIIYIILRYLIVCRIILYNSRLRLETVIFSQQKKGLSSLRTSSLQVLI